MSIRRLAAAALGLGLAAGLLAPTAAAATTSDPGTRSLAEVLTSDGNRFDRHGGDFDITTEAVLAVLEAKPDSPVGLLADGTVELTAFVPNDRAFRRLVKDLTGRWVGPERKIFEAVAGLGIDTVETVLLYHVVPGAPITAYQAFRADDAELTTALGSIITVQVYKPWFPQVRLVDQDPDDLNPRLVPWLLDINRGNKQVAHGINRVLRPVDL